MKTLYITLFFLLFTSGLYATQEIQRIDSIVNDITQMKQRYEAKLFDEKEKNIILEHENKIYKRKIKSLENKINILKKTKKTKEKRVKKPIKLICKDDNVFPKLKLRRELSHFKASAFRLKKSANIYKGIDSLDVVARWDKGTSFTSNLQSQNRIKITGYFVKRVWQKAKQEMWVDRADVLKR